jgi:hypothetical protein
VLCLAAPRAAVAQVKFTVQPEARAELSVARANASNLMIGANVPADYLVRVGLSAGGGTWWTGNRAGRAARADATVRLLLDPFGEVARGYYVGGGLTASWTDERRAGLMLLVGVEGKVRRGHRLAAELALGQGLRGAVIIRRARPNAR